MHPPTTLPQRVASRAAVSLVALVGAIVSYAHMYEVATVAGEAWRAWLLPLSVDGLVVAASLGAWQAKRRGTPVPTMTVVSLAAGLAVSLAANVAAPFLPWLLAHARVALAATVAAWPAVALALAFEELLRQARRSGDTIDTAADATGDTAEATPAAGTAPAPIVDEPAPVDTTPDMADVDTASTPDTTGAPTVDTTPTPAPIDTTPAPTPAPNDSVRDEAREYVRQMDRADERISGKALGERYGRGEAWGRNQIRAAREEATQRPALVAVEA